MSKIVDQIQQANQDYAAYRSGKEPLPKRQVVILTCMDARIEPLAITGLTIGDAHVIRNAGGRVTDDVIRSLMVSSGVLETKYWLVIQHTDCGMTKLSEAAIRDLVAASPRKFKLKYVNNINFLTFIDVEQNVKDDVALLKSVLKKSSDIEIYGFVYDVESGKLSKVT